MSPANGKKKRPLLPPYIWEDADGAMHFDVPRFLEWHGFVDTPENRETAGAVFLEQARKLWPSLDVKRVTP